MAALANTCFADEHKLAAELKGQQTTTAVNVIVQYKVHPGSKHLNSLTQHGGASNASLDAINGLAVSLPANQLKDLANDPDVAYISPDRPVQRYLSNTAPAVNAGYAWSLGFDGTGIGVAVIDSGIQDFSKIPPGHLKKLSTIQQSIATTPSVVDLHLWNSDTSRVVYSQSWINDGLGSLDGDGHGTHVAGIIAGNGYSSTGTQYSQTFKGIAPNANIVNLRVLDSHGAGTVSNVIAAIQTAIKLKSKYNIRVINMSLGTPVIESYKLDPLCQAAEAAWKAGIVVVVSAGNEGRNNTAGTNGYGTISSPGNDPYVITVGAMKTMGTPDRADDLIASYSSKGPTSVDHIASRTWLRPGTAQSQHSEARTISPPAIQRTRCRFRFMSRTRLRHRLPLQLRLQLQASPLHSLPTATTP